MVSKPRIMKAGGIYHVYNRGVLRQAVFHDVPDREYFLALLEEVSGRCSIEIRSYCLMTNHIHLHFLTPRANIAEAMHWLFTRFSCYFNVKYSRTGHVFETRYKSPLVEPGRTEVELSRYNHRNPVVARMVDHAAEYPWSSMRFYLNPGDCPDWLHPGPVLARLSAPGVDVIPTYLGFVNRSQRRDAFADRIFARATAVGTRRFLLRVATEHGLRPIVARSTEEVLDGVAECFDSLSPGSSAPASREPLSLYAAAYVLKSQLTLTSGEIGKALGGQSGRTVDRYVLRARNLMATDTGFRKQIEACLWCEDDDTLRTI
jgi:putative transposase